ncbi:MAG TPA: diguanylate cyclase [Usitatibacter sp.]|nr:diguanylate cyclase [Usitatibacter sp.]
MDGRPDGTHVRLRSGIPVLVLAASLALTALGWLTLERSREAEARSQFERRTDTALAAVRARVFAYEQVLRSGAARMASSPTVSRDEWRDFVAYLQLDERFPGIQAMGYAPVVDDWARPTHVQGVRDAGFPDYDIRPAGEHGTYAPAMYIEPFAGRNARLLGLDLRADGASARAMAAAAQSGDVALSAKAANAGEFGRVLPAGPVFFMYAPLYHDSVRVVADEERRPALAGFAFIELRMTELMRGILDEGVLSVLDMRIHDDGREEERDLLIDTRTAWRGAGGAATPRLERIGRLVLPGRTWTVRFASRPEFDAAVENDRPWAILVAGIAGSVVVFVLTAALVATLNRAHHLSMRDPLTGLFNRRYLDVTMERELQRARREGAPIGAILLDLDHFKRLNDSFGHDAGDYVLERTGELLAHATRGSDIACRFGGEEFALILPGASLENTRKRAEAIRASFEALDLVYGGTRLAPLSLSAGVSALPAGAFEWASLLHQADKALYAAKESGRNRVVAAPQPEVEPA